MGRWHAHAAGHAGARVAAVVDPDRSRADRLAARHRGCRVFVELREALDDVDIVHVCTPSPTHVSVAAQALAARRHVLVEKPLAPTADETADLLAIAESQGVLLCPVYQFLFQDGVQTALTGRSAIGPLRHADVTICSAGAEGLEDTARERVALEILLHPLSLFERLLPGALAELDWSIGYPAIGEIRALGRAGDVTVSILVSMSGRPTMNRMQLIGTTGSTHVDMFHGFAVTQDGAVSRARKLDQPFVFAARLAGGAAANLVRRVWRSEPAYPGLRGLVERFYDAATRGGPNPISPAETFAVARAYDRLRFREGHGPSRDPLRRVEASRSIGASLMAAPTPTTSTLSVIVTSPETSDILRACLTSLVAQEAAREIVVADCSREDPTERLRAEFPGVRVLHFADKRTVPELRWAALAQTRGSLVAATESRSVPHRDWCAALVGAHQRAPDAPAIGGAIGLKTEASLMDWGLYLSEYARFAPPLPESAAREISGANLSYKRHALDACRDQLDAGVWEIFIHQRWLAQGKRLGQSPATVVFHNGLPFLAAIAMRVRYGRSYAADRCATVSKGGRLWYALGSPVLPLLLTWRLARTAQGKRLALEFFRSLPWSLAFNVAWSCGEFVGYVRGR